MNRDQKAAVVDEVAGEIGGAEAIFAVDYRGITVAQVAELRTKLRDSDTKLRVVKNSLSERAADQAGAAELKTLMVGPTALALVGGDAAAAAKVLSDTARALRGPLEFKGGWMAGTLLTPKDVEAIAKMPSRDVLNGQLVGTIAAPLNGLVRTLNALISGLAVQLGQIAEQGLVSGTAEAPVAEAEEPASAAAAEATASPDVSAESDADAIDSSETSTEAVSDESTEAVTDEATDAPEAPATEATTEAAEEPEAEQSAEGAAGDSEAHSGRAEEAAAGAEASMEDSTKTEGSSDDAPSNE